MKKTLLCDDIPRAMATPIYAQMLETVGATGIVMRATGGAIPELLLMEEIRRSTWWDVCIKTL